MRLPEILSLKLIIPHSRFGRPKAMRCAGGHPDHIVGDRQQGRDLVTGDDHGAPSPRELTKYLTNKLAIGWIDTGERLISKETPRRADPDQRNFGTAPFSA